MDLQSTPVIADDQLIQYYLNGDAAALETLVYLNKDKIYKSIYSVVQDRYVADDIFQDVFIRIIDTLMAGKYIEEGKFLPWAMRIAHNMCIDHFRKLKTSSLVKTKNEEILEVVTYDEPDAGQTIMNHESHEQIRRMID